MKFDSFYIFYDFIHLIPTRISMSDSYSQIAFALEILKLLSEKPYRRKELVEKLSDFFHLRGMLSDDIDIPQKLTRMIAKLRESGFEIQSAPNRPYILTKSNFPIIISSDQREALAMAVYVLDSMGFTGQSGQITQLIGNTSPAPPSQLHFNFNPPIDYSEEHIEILVATLQQRIQQRRRYIITYRSRHGNEKTWDLDRSELRFHNGVLYLFAHAPDDPNAHNHIVEKNKLFHINRIIKIGAASEIPWGILHFPTITLRYRMSGELANYQPRRNHERIIAQDPSSWIEIETQEDYLFWFRQRLLQYGESVKLIEPNWYVRQIAKTLQRSAQQYELNV
jgi:predicted DNA-binding transcriptional regulator YafY